MTGSRGLLMAIAGASVALTGARVTAGPDIEVPAIVLDQVASDDDGGEGSAELDLANLVQAAAKGRTTVQEAPAIVTVITADELRERGHTNLEQAVDTVPGWLRLGAIHGQFPFMLTRGTLQATMYMHNGLSLFEPMLNVPSMGRIMPLELVKRIELITGPGGVLWGANSYMGIVNVITKDARDVDGVEAGIRLGHGNGDRGLGRVYAMAGIPRLGGSDDVSLFLHASAETYIGPGLEMPIPLFLSPLPQPNSPTLFGPLSRGEPRRSRLVNFNGKLEIGPVDITVSAPMFVSSQKPLGFSGSAVQAELPDDTFEQDGELACPFEEPFFDPNDECIDKGRVARESRPDFFERYLTVDYRTRFSRGRAGSAVKGYFVQFVRRYRINVLPPVEGLLEGGLGFDFDATTYRSGASYDGDIELPGNLRMLYGFEGFRDWMPENTERSRQPPGIESTFLGPYQLDRLPLACPLEPDGQGGVQFIEGCPQTFAFSTNRTVLGAYLNPQWRPTRELILDGGVRVQGAPSSLGDQPYDTQLLLSGSLVYGFYPGWHAKLNYAEGTRPPVFSNTNANGESTQIGGDPDLEVETSQALQAEINARIFKGKRRLRELNFRADYSYTRLNNLIQVVSGAYENTADRGIHSAEFLGKLYIQGGHRLELSYTWLRINMGDKGRHRSMPEHWFNLGGVFSLVPDKLLATTSLRVLGAMEDANRIVEHRDFAYDDRGRVIDTRTGTAGTLLVQPHELVLDRLPPGADLTAGLIYTGLEDWRLAAMAYNAFNARYYQPDAFFDYEPRLEFLPNPYEDFRFIVEAVYNY